jgi:D-arabinose 1-dehydrogenase-like Zn-dependent alcohol dehydrogenase
MRAVQMHAVGEPLRLVEVPRPEPGPRDAVIEVLACGICRSDWHLWQGDWSWEGIGVELPRILGHEASGVVRCIGPEVRSVMPGMRVCVPFHEACGRCTTCLSGATQRCPDADYIGSSHDGAFAQFARIPNADVNCVPLPDAVDPVVAAAMGCRYMTAFHAAVHRARAQPGEWAVVYGCGGLGLSLVQILAALGAQTVAVDVDEAKLAHARRLGAVHVVDAGRDDPAGAVVELTSVGAHVGFDALGSSVTFRNAIDSLRPGGRHVQVGLTTRDDAGASSIPLDRITFRELEIVGSIGNPVHAYPELLALVARGTLRPREIVTAEVSLGEVPAAIERMSGYGLAGLVVVSRF